MWNLLIHSTHVLEGIQMSSVLVIVSIAFAGFLAYIIGERIHEIRTALICNESTEKSRREKEHFAVVRTMHA